MHKSYRFQRRKKILNVEKYLLPAYSACLSKFVKIAH